MNFNAAPGSNNSRKEVTPGSREEWDKLKADPVAGPVLEKHALAYLQEHDQAYLQRDFTGNISPDGQLELKTGGYSKASENLSTTQMMQEVIEKTKAELKM